jgi:hypothetical protein
MATIPASGAKDLPAGVGSDAVLWEEVLEAGEYAAHRLPRTAVLRLTDLEGDACAHVSVHHAALLSERLNLADTTKVQWQMYPTTGSVLLSDRGRALMTIRADTSARHDTICSAPNRALHVAKYGRGEHPNARDRLINAMAKFGMDRRDLPPTISFFKGVRVAPGGAMVLDGVPGPPGTHVELRAELDVLVSVANVPHALDTRSAYTCTALRLTAWADPTPRPDATTPEVQRAYDNTDDWLLGAGSGP